MTFNGSKFQLVRYGKNQMLKNDTIYFTDNMEDVIEEYETLKDLGVHMNNNATFSTNGTSVTKKSRQKIGWILRSFHSRNIHFMKQMFKTLLTPHIDYNSQLYLPIECSEIQQRKKIQRDYFIKIPALCGLSYWEQIDKMNMLSLQRRLERYRIIYSWKVLENLVPNCGIQEVKASAESRQGRRLVVPDVDRKAATAKQLDQVFQVHEPKLFNCLPARIRNLSKVGLDEFKSALDKWLESIPDQPKIDGPTPWNTGPVRSLLQFNNPPNQMRPGRWAAAQIRGLGQGFILLYCIRPALGPTSGPREDLQCCIA